MSKYRIYELAKEYNTSSKVIIDILARHSITAKNHMSSVDDDAKTVINRTFARKSGPEEQAAAAMESNKVTRAEIQSKSELNTNSEKATPIGTNQALRQPGTEPVRQQNVISQNTQSNSNQQSRPFSQQQQNQRPQQGQQHSQSQQRVQQHNQYHQNGQPGQQRAPQQQNYQQGQPGQQRGPQQQNYQQGQPGQQRGPQQQNYQQGRPGQQRGPQQQNYQQGQPGQQRAPQQQNYQQGQPGQQRAPQQQNYQQGRPGQQRAPQQQNYQQGQPGQQRGPQQQNYQQKPPTATGAFTNNSSRKPAAGNQQRRQGQNQHGASQRGNHGRPGAGKSPVHQTPMAKTEASKPKVIKLGGPITVKELAGKLSREVSEVIKKLMLLGIMATINQEVDFDTASILAGEFGATVEELPPEEDPTEIPEVEDAAADLQPRPPVVTIMGHVDHGKTSLLDSIRQTHVTTQEAGGITQHIGAYQVNYQGKKIVFLDTPGHEAFTAMRARGAQVTDIAILVVSADDGVMPQTIEAINHAKSAKVPIIVAINKIDRPGANPDRVKQQLAEHELVPEDWGGDTIMVPVSALKKIGLTDLLEMILLVAEMQELKANPNRAAFGTIIEAQLDKGRGTVATVLVQKGTLRIGDSIIAGTAYGKVRAMVNDRGDKVKKADPSTPVEVLGLSDVPQAGDILVAMHDEKAARTVAEKRLAKKRTDELQQAQKISLDDLFKQIQDGNIKDLNILVKADVQGSIEALRQALVNLKNKEVRVSIVHAGVGAINESDVMLASASNALIIGFNVRPDANARKAADNEKVDIRTYRVIYDAINDVEAAMTGMLAPVYKEVIQGRAEVRQVISIPKGVVAGSYVLEGKLTSTSQVRIIRDGIVVQEAKIESLRRFKDDVKEVNTGYECGLSIEKFRDIKEGDIVEAFTMELVK